MGAALLATTAVLLFFALDSLVTDVQRALEVRSDVVGNHPPSAERAARLTAAAIERFGPDVGAIGEVLVSWIEGSRSFVIPALVRRQRAQPA